MPKPSERVAYTLNVIEFVAPPVGPLEIIGYNSVPAEENFDYERHQLPRLIGQEGGRRRFLLTLDMAEEVWIDERGGRRGAKSRMETRTTLYRSVWLVIGEPWFQRLQSAWRLFAHAQDEESAMMRERLREGWTQVQHMLATEAYRFWRLRELFEARPPDDELSTRLFALDELFTLGESDPDDILVTRRMLEDLFQQVESVHPGWPW